AEHSLPVRRQEYEVVTDELCTVLGERERCRGLASMRPAGDENAAIIVHECRSVHGHVSAVQCDQAKHGLEVGNRASAALRNKRAGCTEPVEGDAYPAGSHTLAHDEPILVETVSLHINATEVRGRETLHVADGQIGLAGER